MLGKFIRLSTATSYSNRADVANAIVLGDDNRYWVVTLAKMERLLSEGYELAD